MNNQVRIRIDTSNPFDYEKLIKCKTLPKYTIENDTVITDEESYNFVFGRVNNDFVKIENSKAFDYQLSVANTALERKVFAAFLDCGLGKTFITLMWHKALSEIGKTLLVCPLSVVNEFINDARKLGIDTPITVLCNNSYEWSEGIGIINYEDRKDIDMSSVAGISVDESSILKNESGSTKNWLVGLASNIEYRLCTSATPAPNEQSEYATHAVFLGIARTEKEFYSRFFRKQGNSFVLKPHAVKRFYKYMQSFSCYIHNPNELGFECGGYLDEEPEYILDFVRSDDFDGVHHTLFSDDSGFKSMKAIERYRCIPNTDRFNKVIENSRMYESAIIWCSRNDEADEIEKALGSECIQVKAKKGHADAIKRVEILDQFRAGEIKYLVSKPSILGFGVNLQCAEAHVYSGYDQSMEKFYQSVRRSHRYGRNGRLKVHIPMMEAERPIFQTIERKLKTFAKDVRMLQMAFNS